MMAKVKSAIDEEIAALEREFNSSTSTMPAREFRERLAELKGRKALQERSPGAVASTAATAPAATSAFVALPAPDPMAADKTAKLKAYQDRFAEARDRGDVAALRAIAEDDDYRKLEREESLHRSQSIMHEALQARRPESVGFALVVVAMASLSVQKRARTRTAIADARIKNLEQRLAAMEAKKGIDYRSTWQSSIEYGENDAVTYSGQLWLCRGHGVRSKPGDADTWRLVSKTDLKP